MFIDLTSPYALETGLSCGGPQRKLADYVLSRLAVPCKCRPPTVPAIVPAKVGSCADCGGLGLRLLPAAVLRLHQIIRAVYAFAQVTAPADVTAQRWAARRSAAADKPMYLGAGPLPTSVPRTPSPEALSVASLTWRRGLRSELLVETYEPDVHVLWERLPDTHLPGDEPWTEIFAWTNGGPADPARSAQRLVQRGWAYTNPAYSWLATCKFSTTPAVPLAFTVKSAGLLSAPQLEWLFRSAFRIRRRETRPPIAKPNSKRYLPAGTQYIGPYPYGTRPASPKALDPRAPDHDSDTP